MITVENINVVKDIGRYASERSANVAATDSVYRYVATKTQAGH